DWPSQSATPPLRQSASGLWFPASHPFAQRVGSLGAAAQGGRKPGQRCPGGSAAPLGPLGLRNPFPGKDQAPPLQILWSWGPGCPLTSGPLVATKTTRVRALSSYPLLFE